jgi:protein CpxP
MALLQRTFAAAAATAALAGAITLPVWAQSTPAAMPTATVAVPHKATRPTMDMASMHARHMERVKPLLQLTPAQEGAWKQFVEATRPQARTGQRTDREAWSKLTTPERIDQTQTLRKAHLGRIEQRENATKAFYASLNSAQQKAFDVAMPMRGHGKGHGMQKRGHGPHGDHLSHRGPNPRPTTPPGTAGS